MFSRFKQAITKTAQEQSESNRKRSADVSFLSPKEIEEYRKIFTEINANIQQINDIALDSKQSVKAYIKQQLARKQQSPQNGTEDDGQEFTLIEDMEEIKTLVKDVMGKLAKIQQTNEEVKDRARTLGGGESKQLQEQIRKYETQLKSLRVSEENHKEILTTLRQQTELLTKQTKSLQEKNLKLEKDLLEKTQLATNLNEEKKILLQMRHIESNSTNPQVENLKNQLAEGEKKLAVQRTKVQQKEKEIETLKKKLEEDRDSLEKIADQLKEKQLKSKKIIDKYERSKTEIRKYREEKTQFIKKLNLQIASLSEKAQKFEATNTDLTTRLKTATDRNEILQGQLSKNQGRGLQLQSARAELKQVRQEHLSVLALCGQRDQEVAALRGQVQQLQSKRKALLQALQKPINHEIRTLDRIIRALEKLYKEYIEVVFTQGNIIGFENKISYILSNVCEIKEDLKL